MNNRYREEEKLEQEENKNRDFKNKDFKNKDSQNKDFKYKDFKNKDFKNKDFKNKDFKNKDFKNKDFNDDEINDDEINNEDNLEFVDKNVDDEVNEELEKLKEENKKLKEQYLRVLADSENYKKRIDEERIRERKYGSQRFVEKLVNSLDIFDKAVNMKTDDEVLKNFLLGFEMINNNLKQIMEEEGVKKIVTKNEMFNPKFHHAVETDWDENFPEDAILSELQSGYMFKDRVLRPAMVKVNKLNKLDKQENNSDKENK